MKDVIPPSPTTGKSLMERVEDALLPLINLVFLLLMFFIVAGQMQERTLPELPGTALETGSDRPRVDLIVLATGDWQVDGRTVSAGQLARHLPAASPQTSLTIGAAAGTTMADLELLFSELEAAGYQDIILMTEPAGL